MCAFLFFFLLLSLFSSVCVCKRARFGAASQRVRDCEHDRRSERRGTACILRMFRTCGRRQPKRCQQREKRHVTLDRGEIGGYDWLFSDVTDCESSQLEAITRCLVTPSASPPQRRRPLLLFPLSALRQHFVSVSLISFFYKTITLACLLTFCCGCCPLPVCLSVSVTCSTII